jgi:tetratricopeptide (TPR) repeat protein
LAAWERRRYWWNGLRARLLPAGPALNGVFDWSFYSQGTREQGDASSDQFFKTALTFFGDTEMAESAASPWDKGARLAKLVAERPTLLVLDGLEPLQYPPGQLAGKLKDPAMETLLKGLARLNPGLCVVTTRESLTDLAPFSDKTSLEKKLEFLSEEAGAQLLHQAGVKKAGAARIEPDDNELKTASREVAGHALTLRLLGNYLALAENGDIRRRSVVRFEDADREYITNPDDADKAYGHAFKVIAAYENWFAGEGLNCRPLTAVLRMMGLFDRPADAGCLAALRAKPSIPGLTEPLINLNNAQWKITLSRLSECGLITIADHISADTHPLIREYFAKQLREQKPRAWRAGHRRLYEHLTTSTNDKPEPTLEDLQPLYQAIAHGCHAGMHKEAFMTVYTKRIQRSEEEYYSINKLGAFGADLGAVACFFKQPWGSLSPGFSEFDQIWLLNEAALSLHALGRLIEALEPIHSGLDLASRFDNHTYIARAASNLSNLELTLGKVSFAMKSAKICVKHADLSSDYFEKELSRSALGEALNKGGQQVEAFDCFLEAESFAAMRQPNHPLLYSVRGFRFCELLLATEERASWKSFLLAARNISTTAVNQPINIVTQNITITKVEQRVTQTLMWTEDAAMDNLSAALDHLTLARVGIYRAMLTDSQNEKSDAIKTANREMVSALGGLRRSGNQDDIPSGLLSRAWLCFIEGNEEGAKTDLDEAWDIAERGPMRLHMADIHLHRARLFRDKEELRKARAMIEECGYWRRKEELEDAEEAAKNW